jgi:DNA-binding transcriptional regulator LsrR (DeoR family)
VSRLLRKAREFGIVRIEVLASDAAEALGDELADRLGIRRAVVIAPTAMPPVFAALAAPTAELLASMHLQEGAVLALSWGRTICELVRRRLPPLPGVTFVPTVGGMAEHDAWFQANEIVRTAAVATGGLARFLHAPAMPSPSLRRSLNDDAAMRATLALWDRLDVAIVGIGAPPSAPGDCGPNHVAHRDPGPRVAVGHVSWRYFDLTGGDVTYAGEERLLAVTASSYGPPAPSWALPPAAPSPRPSWAPPGRGSSTYWLRRRTRRRG